jgi:hypothetical protein
MLKEQRNQVFVFGIVAILGISLATPVAKAALDIERISMCSQKDHLDGTAVSVPWRFEVDIHLGDPGALHYITVTPPTGGMTSFTIYEDSGDWEYHPSPTLYPTLTALQAVYPTGLYTFDFRDNSNVQLNYVELNYSDIDNPGSPVDFTYPSDDGQTGISTNPIFTWTVNSGAGDGLGMSLQDDYEEIYGWYTSHSLFTMETLSWQPGPLDPEQNYWLYVTVVRIKDWAGGPGLPTMTVGGDEFEYILHIGYMNKIEFTTGEPPELTISIDIKPGSYPNSINPKAGGVIPVAILTTADFDASTVDPQTVALDGAGARGKGKSGKYGSLEDVDGDGDLDLVVQIENDIEWDIDATEATLTGETYDGIPIQGTDTVNIVPPE